MKNLSILFLLSIISVILFSCQKEEECSGGLGGDVTLILKPQHHEDPIISQVGYLDSAFIAVDKYDFPGENPSKYDIIKVGIVGSDEVIISGLKCGGYYVFMTGYDTTISQRVKGGIPVYISQSSGSVTKIIPVTED